MHEIHEDLSIDTAEQITIVADDELDRPAGDTTGVVHRRLQDSERGILLFSKEAPHAGHRVDDVDLERLGRAPRDRAGHESYDEGQCEGGVAGSHTGAAAFRGVRTDGPMAPEIPLDRQRPAQFVFSQHVQRKLKEIHDAKANASHSIAAE